MSFIKSSPEISFHTQDQTFAMAGTGFRSVTKYKLYSTIYDPSSHQHLTSSQDLPFSSHKATGIKACLTGLKTPGPKKPSHRNHAVCRETRAFLDKFCFMCSWSGCIGFRDVDVLGRCRLGLRSGRGVPSSMELPVSKLAFSVAMKPKSNAPGLTQLENQ